MPDVLVKRAIEQAGSRDPLVKAMVLLRAARVLAAMDKEAARQVFAEGVAAAETLRFPPEHVFNEAVQIGAVADPIAAVALFRRLPSEPFRPPRRMAGTMLVQSLTQSGDFESGLSLLEDMGCDVGGAGAVVSGASDPALQRRAMAAARERWRAHRRHPDVQQHRLSGGGFFRLFSENWRKLESAEQESWLDELLLAILTDPDQGTNVRLGTDVELHFTRDAHLFYVLNALRALKPADQVAAILRDYPNAEDAAKIYPLGLESVMESAKAKARPAPAGLAGGFVGFGFGFTGSLRDRQLLSVQIAAQRGDPSAVQDLLAEAHRLYREDSNADDPNLAPLVFWPSCHAYREAMYWAGDSSGKSAEPLLTEIPDPDLALFASIELAAGMLSLPQLRECAWRIIRRATAGEAHSASDELGEDCFGT